MVMMKQALYLVALCGTFVACGSSVAVDAGNGNGLGDGGDGGGGNIAAGPTSCRSNNDCTASDFCHFPDGACGKQEAGSCIERQLGCSDGPIVCGCNGETYFQGCNAVEGVDTQLNPATCEPPTGYMACGDSYCNVEAQYCYHNNSAGPRFSECRSLPDDCDPLNPSCDCFGWDKIDAMCSLGGDCMDTNGGITLECFG